MQISKESKDLVFSEGNPHFVHKRCRSKHTNPKNLKATQKRKTSSEEGSVLNLRSADPEFSFKTHCFICGYVIQQSRVNKNPNTFKYQYSKCDNIILSKHL